MHSQMEAFEGISKLQEFFVEFLNTPGKELFILSCSLATSRANIIFVKKRITEMLAHHNRKLMVRLETADDETCQNIYAVRKHVIIVIETVNQYQKQRDLIFFDN